jgi:ABC-type multidrug transport system fused ATPase/permease subunit
MAAAITKPASAPTDSRATTLYASESPSLSAREAFGLVVKSWPFIAAQRRLLAVKFALALTSVTFFLLTPWPLKIVIDNVIDGHPLTGAPRTLLYPLAGDNRVTLLAIVAGFLLITAILNGRVDDRAQELNAGVDSGGLDQSGFTSNDANNGWSLSSGLFGLLEVWVTINLTQRINQSIRTALYERFLRSPLKLYADQKIGDAVFRVMHDSAAIGGVLYDGIMAPVLSIAAFVMALIILTLQFPHEPLIPILAALILPVIGIGSGLFGRAFRDQGQVMRERGSDVMAAFEERIAQVQLIKALGQEQRERTAVDAASWRSFAATLRILIIVLVVILILTPVTWLLIGAAIYGVFGQVIAGKLLLGDVTLLATYAGILARPMTVLGSTWARIQAPIAGLRRVHSVLDRLSETQPDGAARALTGPITDVQLRDVSVAYDAGAPVLQHVTLKLGVGELAALAGPNGAGKSTLIFSIPRFIEPSAGAVLFNGIDARELPLDAIRERIGFVFQHEALFSTTIRENIRYGRPAASDAEVADAAAIAGAAEFIERLPDGYATMLGRRGTRLSVGQKERIAIARALLRHPDLLILDEPTAPLDRATETQLMQTLRAIARERIVLLIAHRPETLAACDVVHFIDRGTVAVSAPHVDLMRTSAAYRNYLAVVPPNSDPPSRS